VHLTMAPWGDLVAANFRSQTPSTVLIIVGTPDGKAGWVLQLPGGRPIATPAYADGMLFVGGGYGSHEFYALDSETGRVIWKIQTGDDGPNLYVHEGTAAERLVVR